VENIFSKIKSGYVILFAQQLLAYLSLSFVLIFFKDQNYELYSLILMYAIYTFLAFSSVLIVSTFNLRYSLLLGLLFYVILNLLLFLNWPHLSFWLYPVFGAACFIFFWIPLNYIFFENCQKDTHGREAAIYMVLSSLIGVFMPVLGASIIGWKSYAFLFILGALLHLPLLFYVYHKVPSRTISTNLFRELKTFKGLKTITAAEGALHFFGGVVVPIYSLFFIFKVRDFGNFLAYIGLISLVIAFFVSSHSDKIKKRMGYLYFIFILIALSILVLGFARNLFWWTVLVGVYTMFNNISAPLRLAVSLDVKKVTLGFWRMREIFLNFGRFLVLSLSFLFFYLEIYWPIFVLFSAIALAYPFLVHYKFSDLQ